MSTKEDKLKAINYFLNEVLNNEFPLNVRKEEMLKVGRKRCKGFPEWSDFWGIPLKPIDDIPFKELSVLMDLL